MPAVTAKVKQVTAALKQPGQLSTPQNALFDDPDSGAPEAKIREAEKNLKLAKKSARRHLVSARNQFTMEVLHNRSALLRAILEKQRAEVAPAEC